MRMLCELRFYSGSGTIQIKSQTITKQNTQDSTASVPQLLYQPPYYGLFTMIAALPIFDIFMGKQAGNIFCLNDQTNIACFMIIRGV